MDNVRTIWTRTILAAVGLAIGTSAVAAVFTISASVGGEINGQPLIASASGTGDSTTGLYTLDWTLTSIPLGYSVWGTTYSKPSSVGAALAREVEGAQGLLTLCGGNYSIHEVGTFSVGGVITADVAITTVGNHISAVATLSGSVDLPDLVGMMAPAHTWTPGPGSNQFVEAVVKELIREDGGPSILLDTVATYTMAGGASLPAPQLRDLNLTVLSSFPNLSHPTSATILYESVVRPVPAPSALLLIGSAAVPYVFSRRRRSVQ